MKIKKSLVIGITAASIGLASIAGVGLASANGSTTKGSLIDKLVAQFHLNKADVQTVFDQQRSENRTARQIAETARLDQAVKDGKLTQAQEDAIIAHRASQQAFRASLAGMTEAQRQAAMDTHRASEAQWAKDNNIPAEFARPGGMGHGRGMGWGHMDDDTPMNNRTTN